MISPSRLFRQIQRQCTLADRRGTENDYDPWLHQVQEKCRSKFNVQTFCSSFDSDFELLNPWTLNELLEHPFKHALQLVAAQFDQHRPPMWALRGKIDLVKITQQRAHLVQL